MEKLPEFDVQKIIGQALIETYFNIDMATLNDIPASVIEEEYVAVIPVNNTSSTYEAWPTPAIEQPLTNSRSLFAKIASVAKRAVSPKIDYSIWESEHEYIEPPKVSEQVRKLGSFIAANLRGRSPLQISRRHRVPVRPVN